MAKKDKEQKTNAMRILEKLQIPYEMHVYDCQDFLDGVQVAELLGLPHEEVYKTLVTIGKSRAYYVFVIPIEAELDLKKAARAAGEKSIEMLPLKDLTPVTGYVRGGCTALGMKKQFPVFLQEGAGNQEHIYESGGRRGAQMELGPEDFLRACGGKLADVCTHGDS